MTHVLTQPELMTTAAANVTDIGLAIDSAKAAAAGQTAAVAAAAGDEVSAAAAALFNAYGQEYQAVIRRAGWFHDEFAQLLAEAGAAYQQADIAASSALSSAVGQLPTPIQDFLVQLTANPSPNGGGVVGAPTAVSTVDVALILGGSGHPTPGSAYVTAAYNNYIAPRVTATTQQVLSTPEGLYPVTGIKDLTLQVSVERGLTILNNALIGQTPGETGLIIPGGQSVTAFGYSQSAILIGLELPKLQAAGVPTGDFSATLVGNEITPNGGMLARFPGLNFPSLGLPFYGGMDANTGYTVNNYILEYDGFADFPRYPISLLSDLNAVMGIVYVHPDYLTIPPSDVASAIVLPTTPGYSGGTTYYAIKTEHLPLLEPIRAIPQIGEPLADLLEPDLRYLVNWGYGDPNYGWSTSPADVTTPFGLFPPLSATTALGPLLVSGTQQGIVAAMADIQAEVPAQLPAIPTAPPSLTELSTALQTLAPPTGMSVTTSLNSLIDGFNTAITNIGDSLTFSVSTAAGILPATTDIGIALAVNLPVYNTTLFLDGIQEMINGAPLQGLIDAIGNPLAATAGLGTIAIAVEFLVILSAVNSIVTQTPIPAG